jgi:hypothetical protein
MVQEILIGIVRLYKDILSSIPPHISDVVNASILLILIILYSIFTWKFYRSLSKKDIIKLNLSKYNTLKHPFFYKLVAAMFYFVEYIILMPVLIFFWFAILSLVILVLSNELVINQVLMVSAAMVAGVRILSYYEEDLSKDLAKMFPFTMLAIFILNPSFFSVDRVVSNIGEIGNLMTSIFYFLILIISLEILLRIIDLIIGVSIKGKEFVEANEG